MVRPPSPAHACTSRLVAPAAHTHAPTLVCARDAQATPRPSTPPPSPSSSPPSPQSPLPPRRSLRRAGAAPTGAPWLHLTCWSGPRQRPQAANLAERYVFFRWGLWWASLGGDWAGFMCICAHWDTYMYLARWLVASSNEPNGRCEHMIESV